MKKHILIISGLIITLSLTAFSVVNKNKKVTEITRKDVDVNIPAIKKEIPIFFTGFSYEVGPRFEPIKKADITKFTSIKDFIDTETINKIIDFNSVNIIVIKGEAQSGTQEMGYDRQLTKTQVKLLHALDYDSGFTIRSKFTKYNSETGALENSFSGPHFTIVPEQQVKYADGHEALIDYIKINSKNTVDEANVIIEKTRPVMFYFTVTKEGEIKNVRMNYSTNYPSIDKKMIELIKKTQDNWIPAEDSTGKKINQNLVFSLGVKGLGC